jgi:hypothetical protein
MNPRAPVYQYVGSWDHSAEMHPLAQLPLALVELRLIQLDEPLREPTAAGIARLDPDRVRGSLIVPVDVPRGIASRRRLPEPAKVTLQIPAGIVRTLPGLLPTSAAARLRVADPTRPRSRITPGRRRTGTNALQMSAGRPGRVPRWTSSKG